ncbi:MAG: hypothetical protein AB1656_01160 [Candidatus Omnitrophota bacterium]
MPNYGKFNPSNANNVSTFFSYKESPLTSAKMNRWNGNIAAAFEALRAVCAALFNQGADAVITDGSDEALLVVPGSESDLSVRVKPGWAIVSGYLAGTLEEASLPAGGFFSAPVSYPRYDLAILTAEGELDIVEGDEAAEPVVPETPDQSLTLAKIYQRPGATSILAADNGTQSFIIDERPSLLLGAAHRHESDRSPAEAPNGSRTEFSTANPFRAETLDVYLNGVLLERGVDYSEKSDCSGYTFSVPPLSHYRIQHRYVVDHEA